MGDNNRDITQLQLQLPLRRIERTADGSSENNSSGFL